MRAKNVNTMYRRRAVRPDSVVYRQIRKHDHRRRGVRGSALAWLAGLIVVGLVVAYLVFWR